MSKTREQLLMENAALRGQLEDAQSALQAIRAGEVDALFLGAGPDTRKVYTLEGADQPYRVFVEVMQQGAVTLADDGTVLFCNRRFAGLVGQPSERLLGTAFERCVCAADRARFAALLRDVREGPSQGECGLTTGDGRILPTCLHLSVLPLASVAAYCLVVTDLTERKAHEALAEAKRLLADSESRLRATLASLRETDRRKDEFLATLAHELRNPLAPIRNGLQILKLECDEAAAASVRDMMERQMQQMVRLVDDLLDLSRITRGTVELRRERLALSQVVETALESCRPLIDAAHHQLSVTLPAEPLFVDGDLTRLAQVLLNLLNNAAKYTPEGGRIGMTVERDGDEALIRVRDNGAGIPQEMLPRIFDMFTQVSGTRERAQGGLGVGLTLVRRLVEMHGGSVEAFSAGPGLGSTFAVRLPLLVEAPARADANEPQTSTRKGTRGGRRILVVDDNVDSAVSLSLLMRLTGNEVRTAHDGPSALQLAMEFLPEVVLLDIGLPGMSGYEVARALRKLPAFRTTVLIAQTGWGQEDDRRRSEEAGFNFHLVKPVDFAALQTLLAALKFKP